MFQHRGRRACAVVAVVFAAVSGAAVPGSPSPAGASTTPPVVVLRDNEAGRWRFGVTGEGVQADTTVEPSIAVDPANPMNAVVGYQAGRIADGGAATNGFAATLDGGATWTYGELPKLTTFNGGTGYDRASDPVVAFGPGGVVHYNSLLLNFATGGSAVVNSTSRDGGRTWTDPVFVSNVTTDVSNDKNWIVVDNGDGPGHHRGRVYAAWFSGFMLVVSYSDDEGKTWSPPYAATKGIAAVPLVLPNGDLAVVYLADSTPVTPADPGDANDLPEPLGGLVRIGIVVAPGAGSVPTGGPLVFRPPTFAGVYQGKSVRAQRAGPFVPTADVDQRTGRIYVGWSDARYRTDGVNDVVVVHSDDAGLTWSEPVRVNGGPTTDHVNHYNGWLAVGADGIVRIAYRVRQEADTVDAFSPYVDTYFQQSADGETWSEPQRVNSVRTDVRFAAFSRNGAFLGDYHQVATAGGLTYVVRCEAYPVSADDVAEFPPKVHHQRTWVAVVGPATAAPIGAGGGAAAGAAGGGAGRPPGGSAGRLPATGQPSIAAVLAVVAAAVALAIRRALVVALRGKPFAVTSSSIDARLTPAGELQLLRRPG
jgi:hypothetical protein